MKAAWLAATGLLLAVSGAIAWYVIATPGEQKAISVEPPAKPEPTVPSPGPVPQDARPGLAQIIAIMPDAARHKALYDLLGGADRRHVEDFLLQMRDLPPTLPRTDVMRILYIHFASIDPAGAADHVLGSPHQPSWLVAVFRVWAHADLDAAVRRATSLGPVQKYLIAEALLEMDLPAWRREAIASDLDAPTALAQALVREELATGTPEQAWASALAIPPGRQRDRQLGMAAQMWATVDPAAALRAIAELPDEGARYLGARVVATWASSDPAAALRWLSQQERSDATVVQASGLVREIAATDISAAVTALDEIPPWALSRGRRAVLNAWLDQDLLAAIDWLGTLPLPDRRSLSVNATREFARRDPEGAFSWVMSTDPLLLSSVFAEIDDRATAERLFRSIENAELRTQFATSILGAAPDSLQGALRWAETFDPAVHEQLVGGIFRAWAKRDPDGILREVRRTRDPAARDRAAAVAVHAFIGAFNADAAERLFEIIETPRARRNAAHMLHSDFARADPDPDKAEAYLAIMAATPWPDE